MTFNNPPFRFSHYRGLMGLAVLGAVFFGYLHPHIYTIIPNTEKEFERDSVAILKTLDWLGVFISFNIGVIAHWLHRRLDRDGDSKTHTGSPTVALW